MNNEYNTVINDNEDGFEIFKNKIIKALNEYYGDGADIKENETIKNNGVKLTGVCVLAKDKKVGPTVYLDDFYKQYENGKTLGDIVRTIVELVENEEDTLDFEVDDFCDYEKASKRIVYRLVNTKKNEQMLLDVPHFEYLDMSIIFCYVVESDKWNSSNISGTIVLHNNHIELWNKTPEAIYEIAKKNTPVIYEPELCHIKDIIDRMGGDIFHYDGDIGELPLYVITNKQKQFGAGSILYEGFLEKFSISYQHNIYLIPSSIHEMILVLDNGFVDPDILKNMIYQVNRECLTDTEVLSDSLYYYDYSKRELRLV